MLFLCLFSNFSNYYNRFTMVNKDTNERNNHFFSFNVGPAHLISYSSEFYYFTEYGWDQIKTQYEWLEKELIEANKPSNRAARPWLIIFGHRSMYCGSPKHSWECNTTNLRRTNVKDGIRIKDEGLPKYGLEQLFYKYGVDLEIFGHEHNYHRFFPVYNDKVYNGSSEQPYHNPKAPVHLITGSAVISFVFMLINVFMFIFVIL